jgi:hypothetical protein
VKQKQSHTEFKLAIKAAIDVSKARYIGLVKDPAKVLLNRFGPDNSFINAWRREGLISPDLVAEFLIGVVRDFKWWDPKSSDARIRRAKQHWQRIEDFSPTLTKFRRESPSTN